MRFLSASFLSLALGSPLGAQAPTGIHVDTAIAVPMRDGVVLRADIWRPDREGAFPTLVYRTPYDRRDAADDSGIAAQAVARGYAVVLQDVRGRYASEGDFDAYRHEGDDGYDTIEWAAEQPWSNGMIGTIGLSYPGAVQWLAAIAAPPHLRALVPAMTYATPESFWYGGGVWDGSWLDWTWYNIAPDASRRLGRGAPGSDDTTFARLRAHRPLASLPDLQGLTPWYYEWMRHPPRDPWWSWAVLEGHYQDVSAAVINLSGWFDEPYGPLGAATNYTRLVQTGGQARTRLILGPWTHGVSEIQRSVAGDRDFGSEAPIAYPNLVLDWMDRFLATASTASDFDPPVRVFMMGENQWHWFSNWPPTGVRPDTLYLHGAGVPAIPGSLDRQAVSPGKPASRFRSDPAHPLTDPFKGRAGAHDYRALVGRSDALVFETAPLEESMDIVGPVVAELSASADVADFDLWMQLYDVSPDSTAWNLAGPGNGLLRASYREGGPARNLPRRGKPVRLVLDRTITANRFLPGHKVRIVLSASFTPYFSVNPQTGGQEFETRTTRVGTITIYHSSGQTSRLILPLLPATATH
ncbi:MAG: CocE/NonD family hydrolase [Gemmatimonadota bacterium]